MMTTTMMMMMVMMMMMMMMILINHKINKVNNIDENNSGSKNSDTMVLIL